LATLFIHNANIISFHEGFANGTCDSIAINGNIIEAVGRYDELKSLIHSNTQVIDAKGKTLMPGFNDSHIHIWKVGNLKTFMLDVRGVKSKQALLEQLIQYNRQNPHLKWITARGFNEVAWDEKSLPTKNDLDKVCTTKPIYLIRTCAHIAVCNSLALQIAGIDQHTKSPDGGTVQMDAAGEPTGILNETALGLVTNKIPSSSLADLKIMIRAARDEMYQYGITAATDPAADPLLIQAYKEMDAAGELGFRLNILPIILPDGSTTPYPIPEKYSSDFMQLNTVKFFADGGLSGKTSALKRSYKNSNDKGVLRLDKNQFLGLSRQCMEQGLGVATHAIGDAAIEMVLDVYAQLNSKFPHLIKRIEHLGLPEKKHLENMQANNIACSMQTIFLNELGKNFIQYLDDNYLQQCYPVQAVLQHHILMALSSDAPVVKNFNPLKGIVAAITRQTSEGEIIAKEQSIKITEALKAYTVNAALIGNEYRYGSLRDGQLADFILLDNNPMEMMRFLPLNNVNVLNTYVNGIEVWYKKDQH
jgi:predicted amidohydrolase YtcJ